MCVLQNLDKISKRKRSLLTMSVLCLMPVFLTYSLWMVSTSDLTALLATTTILVCYVVIYPIIRSLRSSEHAPTAEKEERQGDNNVPVAKMSEHEENVETREEYPTEQNISKYFCLEDHLYLPVVRMPD